LRNEQRNGSFPMKKKAEKMGYKASTKKIREIVVGGEKYTNSAEKKINWGLRRGKKRRKTHLWKRNPCRGKAGEKKIFYAPPLR